MPKQLTLIIPFLLMVCLVNRAHGTDSSDSTWDLALGYGQSIPGFGATTERVHTLDIVPRYKQLVKEWDAPGIFARSEFWLEAPLSFILKDSDSLDDSDFGILGLNFLGAFHFPAIGDWQPYALVGGGPVYILADISGVGSDLSGSYQSGFGVFRLVEDNPSLFLELRYHHISNADTADPNVSLNSLKFYFGMSF